jgi:hypothetical protein
VPILGRLDPFRALFDFFLDRHHNNLYTLLGFRAHMSPHDSVYGAVR